MNATKLKLEVLQQAVLEFGWKNFQKWSNFSGKKIKELRKEGLLTPTAYVKQRSHHLLQSDVCIYGSIKAAAKSYSVSESFLKTTLSITRYRPVKEGLTKGQLIDWLEKYGSVRLMSRCFGYSESDIRKIAKKLGVKISEHVSYDQGDHENAKGRRGELAFAEIRGVFITKDCNLDGSQADWDFEDKTMGKVNVKSSREYKGKNDNYWRFSLSSVEKCDFVALVAMDTKMEKVVFWVPFSANLIKTSKKIVTLRAGIIDHIRQPTAVNCLPYVKGDTFIKYSSLTLKDFN